MAQSPRFVWLDCQRDFTKVVALIRFQAERLRLERVVAFRVSDLRGIAIPLM